MKLYNLNKKDNSKLVEARTFMPDIIAPGTGLSPATNKSVIPTNNVTTIEDVLNGKKYQIPGGGGDWSSGEDVSKSYREDGDAYKRQERDLDILKNMMDNHGHQAEQWVVRVPGGRKIFESLNLANDYKRKMKDNGVNVKWVSRIAQTIPNQTIENNKPTQKAPSKVQKVAIALEKTFMVESINAKEGMKQNGASFCVAPNMFITCAHVVRKYNKNLQKELDLAETSGIIQLSLIQGEKKIPAKLIAINALWDLALIQCEINVKPFLLDEKAMIGEDIFTVGSPHGFENNVSFGTVGSLDRQIYTASDSPKYMFVDLAAFTGNSGGPIIKQENGAVIGVLTAIVSATGEYGLNAGLQIEYLRKFCIMNNVAL